MLTYHLCLLGMNETGVHDLLKANRNIASILFPRENEANVLWNDLKSKICITDEESDESSQTTKSYFLTYMEELDESTQGKNN